MLLLDLTVFIMETSFAAVVRWNKLVLILWISKKTLQKQFLYLALRAKYIAMVDIV